MPPAPPPNPGFASSSGMSAPPSFGQQMQGLNSKITPFTSSLRDITRNFAAGFAKDPAVREQYSQQNAVRDESKRREQVAQRQQQIEQLMQNFNAYAEAIKGSGGQVTPSIQKLLDQNVGLLTQVGMDPGEAQMMADAAVQIGMLPKPQGEPNFQQFYNPQTQQSQAVNVSDTNAVQQAKAAGFTSLGSPESSDMLSEGAFGQKAALAQLSAPRQTMVLPPTEGAFQKGLGEARAKDAGALGSAAQRSATTVDQANAAEALIANMQNSGNDPGKLAGVKADTSAYLQSLGLDPASLGLPPDAGPTQAVDAALNKLALQFIGADTGGLPANTFSEADRKFITAIAGTTADTPEGLRLKLETIRRGAEQVVKANNVWLQYPQTELGYEQFIKDWSKNSLSKNQFDDLKDSSSVLRKRDNSGTTNIPPPPAGFVPD